MNVPPTLKTWPVHGITPDLRAQITNTESALPAVLDAEVEALWQATQLRAAGSLFNGSVFSVDEITPHILGGRMTEFRRVVAQMEKPKLHASLGVRQLAVCGVLCCPDGVVFGRRHAGAIYLADIWQLPPAGYVDAGAVRRDGSIDLESQLCRELHEELGLGREAVDELRPLCMVEHPDSRILDLGYLMRTGLDRAAIAAAHAQSGNGEYDVVEVVPWPDVPERVDVLGSSLVPASLVFLRQLGLIGRND